MLTDEEKRVKRNEYMKVYMAKRRNGDAKREERGVEKQLSQESNTRDNEGRQESEGGSWEG